MSIEDAIAEIEALAEADRKAAERERIRLLPSIEPGPYSFTDLVEREDVLAIVEGRG